MAKTTEGKKHLDYYARRELLIGQMQNLRTIMRKASRIDLNNWCVQVEEFTALGQKSIRNMLNDWLEAGRLKAHIEDNFLVSDEIVDETKIQIKQTEKEDDVNDRKGDIQA